MYERSYGGFLSTFGQGSGKDPPFREDEVAKGLGQAWQTRPIKIKPYTATAGTHCTIGCMNALQRLYSDRMNRVQDTSSITIELGEWAFQYTRWKAERPLTALSAQMSAAYVAAVQVVDR